MSLDRRTERLSTDVRLYLQLEDGRRLPVAQVGDTSLIVREDEGEVLASRMAKLIIDVDGDVDEYDVILASHRRETGVVEFA